MANAFLEVFPTLQLNHEMKGLLSEATVTKLSLIHISEPTRH